MYTNLGGKGVKPKEGVWVGHGLDVRPMGDGRVQPQHGCTPGEVVLNLAHVRGVVVVLPEGTLCANAGTKCLMPTHRCGMLRVREESQQDERHKVDAYCQKTLVVVPLAYTISLVCAPYLALPLVPDVGG